MTIDIRINPYGSPPAWGPAAETQALAAVENCLRDWLAKADTARALLVEIGVATDDLDRATSDARDWLAERAAARAATPPNPDA